MSQNIGGNVLLCYLIKESFSKSLIIKENVLCCWNYVKDIHTMYMHLKIFLRLTDKPTCLHILSNSVFTWFLSRDLNVICNVGIKASHIKRNMLQFTWHAFRFQLNFHAQGGCKPYQRNQSNPMLLTHTRPRDMARSRPPFWIFSFAAWKWVNMDGNWRNFDGNISSYV